MSARNFGSLFMVASCAGAALGCYLVSLRVASERAALEDVENRIVLAQRDMRLVQTEIGTRSRLSQLERWNARVLALSAPSADQFVSGGYELARLARPEHKVEFNAPVVLAAAPAPEHKAPIGRAGTDEAGAPAAAAPRALLHEASYKIGTREVPSEPAAAVPQKVAGSQNHNPPQAQTVTAKAPERKAVDKPHAGAAKAAKTVDKPTLATAGPVTRPVRLAKIDPLAPLPDKRPAHASAHASTKPPKEPRPAR